MPSDDEMEAFHARTLGLGGGEEGDESEEVLEEDEEVLEVREVGFGASFDGDEEDEESQPSVSSQTKRITRKWKGRSDFFKTGEESDDEDDEKEQDSVDEFGAENEVDAMEEEEAKLLKRGLASRFRPSDYALDDDGDESNDETDEKVEVLSKAKAKKVKEGDKLERVAAHAPELIGLLSEFKNNLSTLEGQVIPVMEKVESGALPTQNGISYLEAKYHAMLTYCINIAFYLLMKAKGEPVRNHPVIKDLVRVRTVLEKLKPLDIKLKNQLDEILTSSAPSSRRENLKPNPHNLAVDESDEEEQQEEESDVEDEKNGRNMNGHASRNGTYVVRKPLNPESFVNETPEEKQDRKRHEKLKRKLGRSQLLQELTSELTDRPIEEPSVGSSMLDRENRRVAKEIQLYEEEHFTRLRETKKERAERRRREQAALSMDNDLADLEEFGDLEGLVSKLERDSSYRVDERARREQELAEFMRRVEQKDAAARRNKRDGKSRSGDADLQIKDPMLMEMASAKARKEAEESEKVVASRKEKKRKQKELKRQAETSADFVDQDEEDELYRMAKQASRKRRKEKEEMYAFDEPEAPLPMLPLENGKKRVASRKIIKNKGLHAHKRIEDRNPRTKRRKKYQKKLIARKGQVQPMRDKSEGQYYSGEKTGIRTNLITESRPHV